MARLLVFVLLGLAHAAYVHSCGETLVHPNSRYIVNGEEAEPHSFPWMVSLHKIMFGIDTGHWCGASIISDRFILTAAHCIPNMGSLTAVVGLHSQRNRDAKQVTHQIKKMIVHEKFTMRDITEYDIALLELKKPIQFNDHVQPVCLPQKNREWETGDYFTVSGWGALSSNGGSPDKLRQVQVPYYDRDECNALSAYRGDINPNVICAGYQNGGKDACQGDSGGPLVKMVNGKWTQAGVVSWGMGCAAPRRPGVYTHVSKYIDWINKKMA